MFAKNDEEKRNVLWRSTISVSSILIILIGVFFVIRLFTANPLEGTWVSEDSDLTLKINRKDTVEVQWPERFADSDAGVRVNYSIDKEMKTFTLRSSREAVEEAVEQSEGVLTEVMVVSAMESLEATYDYNMEQNQLTLTDREYGDQLVFDKK